MREDNKLLIKALEALIAIRLVDCDDGELKEMDPEQFDAWKLADEALKSVRSKVAIAA